MKPMETILITGANAGLGFECARQLAKDSNIQKIYLACRNKQKAEMAKDSLESLTGRSIFEIVIMDVMYPESVRAAVQDLQQPIDGVVLNAGGSGGRTPQALTKDGVTHLFAVNVLGHAVLIDELLERNLIGSVVLYAGSEAARGIPKMGVARPILHNSSVEDFAGIADGSYFEKNTDPLVEYGAVKLMGAYWMGAMARKYPKIRFVTMSPGGTTGTNGMNDLPLLKKIMFKYVGGILMPLLGMMHSIEDGAKRYVDGLMNPKFASGRFYASKMGSPTGPVVDQAKLFSELKEQTFEDNANQAVYQFV
ncbi:MAG: SDR family NAD(P)-dependent oxidoreductase [Spirochaetota bacterium]